MPVHAFLFPGQGSQSVGMGADLAQAFPSAREVFEEVDDALEQKLSTLMFSGEAEELTRTENAQPALMAVSMAVLRVLEREGGLVLRDRVALVAGHSLGEYSALAAAGTFGIAQAARLLRLRGREMQRAVPAGKGGMAALIGTDLAGAQAVCDEAAVLRVEGEPDRHEVIEIANDNGGGQVVISGVLPAVERAVAIAKERKIKRAVLLPVSAPFHSSLMAPAADAMGEALSRERLAAPCVPLVANVTAAKVSDPDTIRDLLVRQVTGTVRWRESVEAMAAMGVDSIVELGAGKVLAGLVKRINGDVATASVGTPADIEAILKTF
ncbi:malonyl CoA-ACP transacylase [Ameyamaea chiangmaiensis NBRC 103196]|uniref:Malonyl CoA-acyl carrier protein transacylase n=1 Tax=Ameyamaea chiangmaiensis TaxID=442969 RepID=A0A850PBU4_9PROT|nr:ACP S-malonyltransferase [Ameyamaea chiangmaiensis]MBS4074794.1 ACP S-malonyltransferase [Ameyamaea chiangmaiensis]NVN41574.1 ACP S-malonyltransferase [Ameyamaea chiangmaiensis]GBQ62759.1 malonyl CoA-ACP transacylase [Ameyamaea chiangmaiensis NBRC 103196]